MKEIYKRGSQPHTLLQFALSMRGPIQPDTVLKVFPKFKIKGDVSKQRLGVKQHLSRLVENGHLNETQHGWVITDAGVDYLRRTARTEKPRDWNDKKGGL